ncbi:MAG TPA: hypothetical protein VEA16_08860 [Vicinamibacterales bacterium]|nr:hypothetical protein [Vicinamibacterales bacterium]
MSELSFSLENVVVGPWVRHVLPADFELRQIRASVETPAVASMKLRDKIGDQSTVNAFQVVITVDGVSILTDDALIFFYDTWWKLCTSFRDGKPVMVPADSVLGVDITGIPQDATGLRLSLR